MELQRYRKPNIRTDSICKNSQRKYNPAWRNPPRLKTQLKIPNFHTYHTDRQPRPRTPPNGEPQCLSVVALYINP
ncbi:unnamed protein product [Macrosiphum euphorbiae]|uniref:Uncharacterized protein n=1 Tax=Macrosiphum euphorbiae TaxID=13131 RepID=A0AAV0VL61_9HEMI|nr:unnamed protein product [Macrosiphum euphorbiae]